MITAKLFMNGQSQAVRLPAQFRIDADEVYIRHNDDGDVVLSTRPKNWDGFLALDPIEADIVSEDRQAPSSDPFEQWQQ